MGDEGARVAVRVATGRRTTREDVLGFLHRAIVLATIVCLLLPSGCAGWRTVSREEMMREVRGYHPTSVRLLYPDSTLEVRDPSVRGDSLAGVARKGAQLAPFRIALTDVDSASVRKTIRKPAIFLAIPLAVVTLAVVVVSLTHDGDPVFTPDR